MLPVTDIKSKLISSNLELVSTILEDRILDYWLNKKLFKEDTLFVSGLTGVGSKTPGSPLEAAINYSAVCYEAEGVHRFVYYTTEKSLERSIELRLSNMPDEYNIAEDQLQNDLGDVDHNDGEIMHRTFEEPVFYQDLTLQPIDVIDDWDLNYVLGNAVENIVLYQLTEDIDQINKDMWFLLRELSKFEKDVDEGLAD